MSENLKICEHESVDWILKCIPKYSKRSVLIKKFKIFVTSFDVNTHVFVLGTNNGNLFLINRQNNVMESYLLKKETAICYLKLLHTLDLSIAIGFENGSVYILSIPFNEHLIYAEMIQYIVPTEHKAAITCMTWSKNAEKMFSGDDHGHVYGTEMNHQDKTVVSYEVCKSSSKIVQLAYDHRCLLISNKVESFMWNFEQNKRIPIGSKSRNEHGKFGISFINKLCKSEEMEIIVSRPDCRIWISDSNGLVKRSIILKPDALFSTEKLINLLPCVTSQSKNKFIEDVLIGKIKFQLGLSIPISESDILFWSEKGIVIINIYTGHVLSSSHHLGKIKSLSLCHIDRIVDTNAKLSDFSNEKRVNSILYEIWIFREPTCDSDSKLVRISFIPLLTSKLSIDPFYLSSQSKIANNKENILTNNKFPQNVSSDAITSNKEPVSTDPGSLVSHVSSFENFINKIGGKKQTADGSENVNDPWSNRLDFSKLTKEVMKQGQAMFDSEDQEGLEQALELTEDGLVMNFEKNIPATNTVPADLDQSLEVKNDEIVTTTMSSLRSKREHRTIEVIQFDESCEISKTLSQVKEPMPFSNAKNNISPIDDKVYRFLSTSYDIEINRNTNSELDINGLKSQSFSPYNDICNSFSSKISEEASMEISQNEESLNFKDDYKLKDSINDSLKYRDQQTDILNSGITENISNPSVIQTPKSDESFVMNLTDYRINDSDSKSENRSNEFESIYDVNIPDNNKKADIEGERNISSESVKIKLTDPIKNEISNSSDSSSEISDIISRDINIIQENVLTNSILLQCNKWISHRGPNIFGNKLQSMTVNRRMIWLTDTKGNLYVGFRNVESDSNDTMQSSPNHKMVWLNEKDLRTDKISSSPEGLILWREKAGEISVYTGITRIWTPKVVKEKVLLKVNWETSMQEIKEVDIDEGMAVIVTKKGKLKVMDGISSRTPYRQCTTASITGTVTLATIFNGIIWCVTEIDISNTSKLSQHIFACKAKDDEEKLNISYWRTVPLPRDLIKENEQKLGGLGGSEIIRSVQLGANGLSWILTCDGMCFFSENITSENPTGDGIWYQIALQFLSISPYNVDDNTNNVSYGLQNTVEKIFGYSESDLKSKRGNFFIHNSSIIISVKCAPKKAKGNGMLWITSTERNSPCVLFESNRNIMGHDWTHCFPINDTLEKRLAGLPALIIWSHVEVASKNTLWLLHKSGEIFCYYNRSKIRTVAVPYAFGRIVHISARNCMVSVLTSHSRILIRTGITESNPIGTDWREINKGWSKNEVIKQISCSDNDIWLITENHVYYNEDIQSLVFDSPNKLPWSLLNFKMKDSNVKKLSVVQNIKSESMNCIWAVSEPEGYLYMSVWKSHTHDFSWTYIPGPRAKSIHLSGENLWMVEQCTGNIFVRCGFDWINQPMGDYWIHIPLITSPVVDLAVSSNNQVFVIDCHERLLMHRWVIIEGNSKCDPVSDVSLLKTGKLDDQDWEILE